MLEPHAHPSVAVVAAVERAGGGGVRKGKEPRSVAAHAIQSLVHEAIFVVEHLPDPLPRNVALRLAIDGVADGHVVGGNRLRHSAGRPAHSEKPAGHLLAGSDLGEVTVDRVIEVDGKGPLCRRIDRGIGEGRRLHGCLLGRWPDAYGPV